MFIRTSVNSVFLVLQERTVIRGLKLESTKNAKENCLKIMTLTDNLIRSDGCLNTKELVIGRRGIVGIRMLLKGLKEHHTDKANNSKLS